MDIDILTVGLIGIILLLLIGARVGVSMLRRYVDYGVDPAIISTFESRFRIWFILLGVLIAAIFLGPNATTFFFFILSFFALREYITLTPKSPVDHQTLFWVYLLLPLLQFILVGVNPDWFRSIFGFTPYTIFLVLLPGFVFLILPGFMAVSGDPKRFLERTAKLQLGLIVCVYCLSYTPALLNLPYPQSTEVVSVAPAPNESGLEGNVFGLFEQTRKESHVRLLLFFIVIVQLGDVFQYLWSQVGKRYVVAEKINTTRTWEGVVGGAITTALLGVALGCFTPFPKWWQPGLAAFIVSLIGFAGNMTMSAIKRDRGVSGYGSLIQEHGGILDRIDSLCFAAPVFYHLAWLFVQA